MAVLTVKTTIWSRFRADVTLQVILMVLLLVASVSASCTPSTCPPGPVLAVFTYPNCTGDVSYFSYYSEPGCNSGHLVEITSSELVFTDVNNPQCDLTLPNVSYTAHGYSFGVCGNLIEQTKRSKDMNGHSFYDFAARMFGIPTDQLVSIRDENGVKLHTASTYSGLMMLPNVNASFTSPQPYFQFTPSTPFLDDLSQNQECYSVDNCTTPAGTPAPYWETVYAELACGSPTVSRMYPDLNFGGACYNNDNDSYVALTCGGDHGYRFSYYFGDSCNVPSAGYEVQYSTCSNLEYYSYHCIAPSSNPQPSSSSSLRPSLLMILVAFALLALKMMQ
jgi:hypothetical protein